MKRALLVGFAVCLLGALGYGVELLLKLRAATAPPTPEAFVQTAWTLYRLAPGHRIHVNEQGLDCTKCHTPRADKSFDEPAPSVCKGCHAAASSIEHGHVAVAKGAPLSATGELPATDCLSCHGFGPDARKKATDCLGCHAHEKGDSPAVVVHADQQCTTCHDVHENRVTSIACAECHDVKTTHGVHESGSAAQCLDCHHAHARKESAEGRCDGCHREPNSKVFVAATATAGQHTCVGCHAPHDFEQREVKACASCHAQQPVLAGAGHRTCTACHTPHDVTGSVAAKNVCASCHRDVELHHAQPIDPKKACTSCHAAHPKSATAQGPAACTSCHADVASTELSAHAPKMACTGCHTPHDFTRPQSDASACSSCHKPRIAELAKHPGHARCQSCHEALPHGGMGAEKPCASCHEQGARAIAEHKTCTNCHDAHTGKQSAQTCAGCHAQEVSSLSPKHGPCQNCHEPHVAKPTAQIAACTGCHTVAKLPGLHQVSEHRESCQTCHQAHPEAPPGLAATCRGCHDEMKDHQLEATQCNGCHAFQGPPARRKKP